MQAAPGNWAFVLQEVESDSGHSGIYQCLGQCGGRRRERSRAPRTPGRSLASRALEQPPVPSVSAAGGKKWLLFRTHGMMPPILTYFLRLVHHSPTKFRPFLQCVKVRIPFGEQRGEFSSNNVVQCLTSALHCWTTGKGLPEKGGATKLFYLGTFLQVN